MGVGRRRRRGKRVRVDWWYEGILLVTGDCFVYGMGFSFNKKYLYVHSVSLYQEKRVIMAC